MSDQPQLLSRPRIKPASAWSVIWILPILALLMGGWLAWKAYSEAGVVIDIRFDSGDGLQAGKTELFYKGIALGKVLRVDLNQETQEVHVAVEVKRSAKDFLREQTQFWLVKPDVSLAGVTGLETLVSGNYIAMNPGAGTTQHAFIALNAPPPLADLQPGLHLQLRASRLGSLSEGSPVYFRQIQVGAVSHYELSPQDQSVLIKIYIEPEYAHLVNAQTHFWNASGVQVSAGLSGVKVDVESLLSLAVGGIAFDTNTRRINAGENPPPLTDTEQILTLYDSFQEAQTGISIDVVLPNFSGLEANKTQVRWNGFPLGWVKRGKMSADFKSFMAELDIDPRAAPWLTADAAFWVVQPEISLEGISGMDALLHGNYIELKPGNPDKPAQRSFVALSAPPEIGFTEPGLHLTLAAPQAGSVKVGNPVTFRQLTVGIVSSVRLSQDQQQVLIAVLIRPEYEHLVNRSSRFWNASGVTLSGGLSGFEVRSESLASLVRGGIAFTTPDTKAGTVQDGSRFMLYADYARASQEGERISLELFDGSGLRVGTPVRYRGFEMGAIESLRLSDDLRQVEAQILLTQAGKQLARAGTVFKVIRPELSLTKLDHVETLITGPYIEVVPSVNPNAAKQNVFKAQALSQAEHQRRAGLVVTLTTAQRKSLKVGMAVTYRGIAVGEVIDLRLSPDAASVLVQVRIEPLYTKLVYSGSTFWNDSGLNVDFSLFQGAQIRTDSVEALLQGSIAFATPTERAARGAPARAGQVFDLHPGVQEEWLNWRPRIQVGEAQEP